MLGFFISSHAISVSKACSLLEKKKTAVSLSLWADEARAWELFSTVVSRLAVSIWRLAIPKLPIAAPIKEEGKHIAQKKRRINQIPIRPLCCFTFMLRQKYINPPKNVAPKHPKPKRFSTRIKRTQPTDPGEQSVFVATRPQPCGLARMGRCGLVTS